MKHLGWTARDWAACVIAATMGIASCVAGGVGHSMVAAVLALLAGGFVAGLLDWDHAWLRAIVLAVLAIAGAAIGVRANHGPGAFAWCPQPRAGVSIPSVAAVLAVLAFVAVYAGVAADALLAIAARWLERFSTLAKLLQPLARGLGVAVLAAGLLGVAALLVRPYQPFGPGEKYCWDEFCFSIVSVSRTQTLGAGASRVSADGTFYVVHASMEAPWWGRFTWGNGAVAVIDYGGRTYEYSVKGQRALGGIASRRSQCHQIPGAAESETIVFDLPSDVVQPRLILRDTLGLEGVMDALRLQRLYKKPAFNLRYDL